eukprot:1022120-Rhodomonas_salina.2
MPVLRVTGERGEGGEVEAVAKADRGSGDKEKNLQRKNPVVAKTEPQTQTRKKTTGEERN